MPPPAAGGYWARAWPPRSLEGLALLEEKKLAVKAQVMADETQKNTFCVHRPGQGHGCPGAESPPPRRCQWWPEQTAALLATGTGVTARSPPSPNPMLSLILLPAGSLTHHQTCSSHSNKAEFGP